MTYLVELHFFQTAIPLLLILHIKDLDELQGDHSFVCGSLRFENVGEFALSDQFLYFKAIHNHAYMQHYIVADVWHVRIILLRSHLWLS